MKPKAAQEQRAPGVRVYHARSGQVLRDLKQASLQASASNAPVRDVREAFGFMPMGLQGAVVRWRGL